MQHGQNIKKCNFIYYDCHVFYMFLAYLPLICMITNFIRTYGKMNLRLANMGVNGGKKELRCIMYMYQLPTILRLPAGGDRSMLLSPLVFSACLRTLTACCLQQRVSEKATSYTCAGNQLTEQFTV